MTRLGSFLFPISCIVVGLCCGYLLRKLRLLGERATSILATIVVSVTYPTVAFLAIWPASLQRKYILLPLICSASVVIMLLVSLAVSGLYRLSKTDRGAFVMACGLSNFGYTMGGLVCYLFYGEDGLALSQVYVVLWMPMVFLVFFPFANCFATGQEHKSTLRVIWKGIWHVRSLGLLGSVLGISFALTHVPYPAFLGRYQVLKIVVLAGVFITYGVIGLNLRLGEVRKYVRLYFAQAVVKFAIAPLLALLLITIFGLDYNQLLTKVVLTLAFMPTAVIGVLICNVFGLNARLASAMFVINTLVFLLIVLPILALVVF